MSGRPRLVVVGAGMVGLRFVEELLARDVTGPQGPYEITVVGAEPDPAYNRVLLSPLLAGEIARADVDLRPLGWYAAQGVELRLGGGAAAIDPAARTVTLADGARLPFDACVLATGSAPIRLPIPGADVAGVETFRTLADVDRFQTAAAEGGPVAVIGGGLLGIETAYGLTRAGAKVTLIHLMDRLMERQLDAEGAALVKSALEAKGVSVRLSASTEAIEAGPDGAVSALRLKDGETIPAGLVVMAVGVRPEAGLARDAGLEVGRGVRVDDQLRTSAEGVYAIGECAEHAGVAYGLVEPGYAQARALAAHLSGGEAAFAGAAPATNLKVSGVPVFSVGAFDDPTAEAQIARDPGVGVYRKLLLKDDRLIGAVLVGDTTDALWYQSLIREAEPLAARRPLLAFGKAFAEAA